MSNASTCNETPLDEQIRIARLRGADSLRMMRMALAQALHAIDDCTERYDASEDLNVQAECVNLAMQRICDRLLPQLRLDTAADAQAALLLAHTRNAAA
jgi:hypothetical protein